MKYSFPLMLWYGLATFRLAVLISQDSGPWRAISSFRSWLRREEKHSPSLKKADVAHGVECLRCSSIYVALAVAIFAATRHLLINWVAAVGDVFLSAMALSAIAILLNRIPKQ